MIRLPNYRVQIRVKPQNGLVVNFVGRETLSQQGVCITYTGTTEPNAVWLEGKQGHLEKILNSMDLVVITPIQETPRSKVRVEEVEASSTLIDAISRRLEMGIPNNISDRPKTWGGLARKHLGLAQRS